VGTFVYGNSYYGLRSFDQTTGAVEDASATVTATSSIAGVDWIVTMGSGPISVSTSSSSSCSGEVVIIEETDKFSYGSGLYGQNEYTQGDLQTVVTATSSASASCIKIQTASATCSAVSTVSANARRVPEGSALVNGTSTTSVNSTANGARIRESSATSSTTASNSISATRVREGYANPSASATTSASSVFVVSGSATVNASCTTATICNRVRFGSGVATSNASITVLGFATRGGIASLSGTSTASSDSEKIFQGSATSLPSTTITATCNRVQHSGATVSSTSGTLTIGREKWEVVSPTGATWSTIAETSTTWTDIAA